MKKKILTTLLIGATLGTGISAMSTSSANACRLTPDVTIAKNYCGSGAVEMHAMGGKLVKCYPTADRRHYFVEVNDDLYCYNLNRTLANGAVYNGNQECICVNGEVIKLIDKIMV